MAEADIGSSGKGVVALPPATLVGSITTRIEADCFSFARMSGSVPAREVPRHVHETAYFFFVLRGAYATEARNTAGPCGPFSVIFNPSGTTHRDHFLEPDGRFLAVHVPRQIEQEIESTIPVSSVLHDPALIRILRAADRELRFCDSCSPFALEALGTELVASCQRAPGAVLRKPPSWLKRVREQLHEEFSRELTVSSLAAAAGVHPVHLARVFRRFLGTAPGEYLRSSRVDRARTLLASALPLRDVAQAAGFYDQSQFANAFKRTTGMRPGDYRNRFGR